MKSSSNVGSMTAVNNVRIAGGQQGYDDEKLPRISPCNCLFIATYSDDW